MASAKDGLVCRVEGCPQADLSHAKAYYQRYRCCQQHLAADYIIIDGRKQRFCQQCGKFQDLELFDGKKKSCRPKLVEHARRRREIHRCKGRQPAGAGAATPPSPSGPSSLPSSSLASDDSGSNGQPSPAPTAEAAPACTPGHSLLPPAHVDKPQASDSFQAYLNEVLSDDTAGEVNQPLGRSTAFREPSFLAPTPTLAEWPAGQGINPLFDVQFAQHYPPQPYMHSAPQGPPPIARPVGYPADQAQALPMQAHAAQLTVSLQTEDSLPFSMTGSAGQPYVTPRLLGAEAAAAPWQQQPDLSPASGPSTSRIPGTATPAASDGRYESSGGASAASASPLPRAPLPPAPPVITWGPPRQLQPPAEPPLPHSAPRASLPGADGLADIQSGPPLPPPGHSGHPTPFLTGTHASIFGTAAAPHAWSYEPAFLLHRVSVKWYGCGPEHLPPDSRPALEAFLDVLQHDARLYEQTVNAGCVHIVADVLLPAAAPEASALAALSEPSLGLWVGDQPSLALLQQGSEPPAAGSLADLRAPALLRQGILTRGSALRWWEQPGEGRGVQRSVSGQEALAAPAGGAAAVAATGRLSGRRPPAAGSFPRPPRRWFSKCSTMSAASACTPGVDSGRFSDSTASGTPFTRVDTGGGDTTYDSVPSFASALYTLPETPMLEGGLRLEGGAAGAAASQLLMRSRVLAGDSRQAAADAAAAVVETGEAGAADAAAADADAGVVASLGDVVDVAAEDDFGVGHEEDEDGMQRLVGLENGAALLVLVRALTSDRFCLQSAAAAAAATASQTGGPSRAEAAVGEEPAGRVVLQYGDRITAWQMELRPRGPAAAATGAATTPDAAARPDADAGGAAADAVVLLPLPAPPPDRQPPPPACLLRASPAVVVAGEEGTSLELALELPQGAAVVGDAGAETAPGVGPGGPSQPPTVLHVRCGGTTVAKHALGTAERLAAAAEAEQRVGPEEARLRVRLPLPPLPSPGLAVVESCRGEALGPWLPLLVVPSRGVADELEALAGRVGADSLRPFLADLGRLLALAAKEGAVLGEEGETEDWAAWEELMAAREAAPDAEATAARLLATCREWYLPHCCTLLESISGENPAAGSV